MLIESIQKGSDAVIPQLNEAIVEGGENPGPLGVKAQPLHSIALRFELCQHSRHSEMRLLPPQRVSSCLPSLWALVFVGHVDILLLMWHIPTDYLTKMLRGPTFQFVEK
jgi:hypothetical protein